MNERRCRFSSMRAGRAKNRAGFLLILSVAACFFQVGNTGVKAAQEEKKQLMLPRLRVCHGYGCNFRTIITMTPGDMKAIQSLFTGTEEKPADEREAIRKAVAVFEERATQVIGVRDEPRMAFSRPMRKGQMDCVDEAVNTETFLRYLKDSGYLKSHDILPRVARGILIDGRYPHWTAVIIDGNRVKWAVDSWYEPGGGEPDIMPLKEWKKHGIGGKR